MVRWHGSGVSLFWRGAARKCSSTMPARWLRGTMRRRARLSSTRDCMPLPTTRVSGCAPARLIGREPRARTSVRSATSKAMPAGHCFVSWAALEGHLGWWMREIADKHVHGTTAEAPIERFARAEAAALRAVDGRPPFGQMRQLVRRVHSDYAIEVDTNAYSVPWQLIGETLEVVLAGGRISATAARRWPLMPKPLGATSGC